MTLMEKLTALCLKEMSHQDLRTAAKVALVCGDTALAAMLQAIHKERPRRAFVPRLVVND